jgi:hypothetical protein
VNLNCVQRCPSIVIDMAIRCDLMVSLRTGRRLRSLPREQQLRTSHHRADAGPCIDECFYFGFDSAMFLNSNTSLSIYFFCNSRTHVITLYSGHECVVLCVNVSVLTHRMDPG